MEADTNGEQSWTLFKKVVMRAAEEICEATKGGKHLERKTRWWNGEVQESLRIKKDAFMKWHREAKAAVAKAKKRGI